MQIKTYKRSMTKKKKVIRNFSEIDDEIFWGNAEIRNFVGRRVKKGRSKIAAKIWAPRLLSSGSPITFPRLRRLIPMSPPQTKNPRPISPPKQKILEPPLLTCIENDIMKTIDFKPIIGLNQFT